MNRSIVNTSTADMPNELTCLFADPPLIRNEKREHYDQLCSSIIAAVKPADPMVWMLARDVVDLSWDILRERRIKADIIKSAEIRAVKDTLFLIKREVSPLVVDFLDNSGQEARQWATNLQDRHEVTKHLLENGFSEAEILAQAFIRGAPDIDAIDRRIAGYEVRRMAALRSIQNYSEWLAQRMETVTREIIDAEFSEAMDRH